MPDTPRITGSCYCGATKVVATQEPHIIAYCHCRRHTGAPVAVFAAFDEACVTLTPDTVREVSINSAATRSFCTACGSPLTGKYDYLPGQIYIALGLLDQADRLVPQLHAHFGERLAWLNIDDDLDRVTGTSRCRLTEAQS